jgi:hypothetical protein
MTVFEHTGLHISFFKKAGRTVSATSVKCFLPASGRPRHRAVLSVVVACAVFVASVPSRAASQDGSPIFDVRIPAGYRQWQLIAPSHEAGSLDELRGILGNPVAVEAYRKGTLPFPDGTILAKLAWKHEASSVFPGAFFPGRATTVQIMIKDSVKYASTGGWGFGRFMGGVPVSRAQHETCYGCHQAHAKSHDDVFTRYAP